MLLAIAPYGFVLTPVKNKRIHKASVIFERDKGIEPSSPPWEGGILPVY